MLKTLGLRGGITQNNPQNKKDASRACYNADPNKAKEAARKQYSTNPEPKKKDACKQYRLMQSPKRDKLLKAEGYPAAFNPLHANPFHDMGIRNFLKIYIYIYIYIYIFIFIFFYIYYNYIYIFLYLLHFIRSVNNTKKEK